MKAYNWGIPLIPTQALLVRFMSHFLYSRGKPRSKLDGPDPIAGLKALKKREITLPYQETNSGLKPISLVTTSITPSQLPQKITK